MPSLERHLDRFLWPQTPQELESLSQADELLKKLGLKAGLFGEGGKPPAPKGGGKGEGAGASADG
jgi:hypothetical protein